MMTSLISNGTVKGMSPDKVILVRIRVIYWIMINL